MELKPEDLGNISFQRAFGGYNKKQVDDTMSKVIEMINQCTRETAELKAQNQVLTERVQHYKTIEQAMQRCLVIAQQTGDEMIASANEKAKTIVSEAESTATEVVGKASMEVSKLKTSYEEMKRKVFTFRKKSEALINAQMDVLKQLSGE